MKLLKRIFLILPVLFLVLTCSDDDDTEKFILSVTITPEEGGSVSPDGGTFEDGTVITLTAKVECCSIRCRQSTASGTCRAASIRMSVSTMVTLMQSDPIHSAASYAPRRCYLACPHGHATCQRRVHLPTCPACFCCRLVPYDSVS